MQIELRILRFDPEKDSKPHVETYQVEAGPMDRVLDMEAFFAKLRSVQPYLQNDGPLPERERRQSAADRARFDDTTKCILCAACTTACPSFWAQPSYVGPAAIVNL